jgi:hypothetical protein
LLAESNTDVQDSVRNGEVASTVAVDILREHGSDAGKVIKEQLVKAKDSGKSKVTRATMQGRAIPRKLTERVTTSFDRLFSALPASLTVESLSGHPDGHTITVAMPTELLAEMRAAHDEMLKHRAKATEKPQDAPAETGAA